MNDITRRDFIKYCGMGALGFIIKPHLSCTKTLEPLRASDVVQCFDENATTGNTINESVVQVMMDESIKTLTGINEVGEAWKSIFPGITENSVISIKINAINEYLSPHPEFVNCIINGLAQMQFGGIHFVRNNVIVWDRTDWELVDAGYTIYTGSDPASVRYFGTGHSGVGYDYSTPFDVDGVTSYPSRILTEMSNYLINVAVLKDHDGAQVTLTMKNHYGSVNNPGSLHSSGYTCNPDIPALNQQIRDVIVPNNIQKIFIIDGLFATYSGGPSNPPNWNPKLLLMSLDTVACDFQGQNLINEERVLHNMSPLSAPHIPTAAAPPYNLGSTDVNLIEINNPSGVSELQTGAGYDHILQVSPNPVRDNITIAFALSRTEPVNIDLIDASGRIEEKIFAGSLPQGQHRIGYQIKRKLNAGNYFIRLHSNGTNITKKISIMN